MRMQPEDMARPIYSGWLVPDRLAVRQHVIKKLVAAIDDDGAGGFPARVLNDAAPVLLRNSRLRVGQIGHQLPVANAPARLGTGASVSCMQAPSIRLMITNGIARIDYS